MIRDIKKVKDRVYYILERYPQCRECDKKLWLAYQIVFHNLKDVLGSQAYERYKAMLLSSNFPTMESVRRVRQKYQEEGLFLPSERVLAAKREEREAVRTWAKE